MPAILPICSLLQTHLADADDREAEGWVLSIRWLGFVVEFTVARDRGR